MIKNHILEDLRIDIGMYGTSELATMQGQKLQAATGQIQCIKFRKMATHIMIPYAAIWVSANFIISELISGNGGTHL